MNNKSILKDFWNKVPSKKQRTFFMTILNDANCNFKSKKLQIITIKKSKAIFIKHFFKINEIPLIPLIPQSLPNIFFLFTKCFLYMVWLRQIRAFFLHNIHLRYIDFLLLGNLIWLNVNIIKFQYFTNAM